MCWLERKTDRRGLPAAFRLIWVRTRRRRRVRRSVALGMGALLLLAFLADDLLFVVLDALALVRLGGPEGADLRGHLAHALLVGAGHRDERRPLALDLHVRRNRVDHVVA